MSRPTSHPDLGRERPLQHPGGPWRDLCALGRGGHKPSGPCRAPHFLRAPIWILPACTSVELGSIHSPAGGSRFRERLWARGHTGAGLRGLPPTPRQRAPGSARASHGQLKAFILILENPQSSLLTLGRCSPPLPPVLPTDTSHQGFELPERRPPTCPPTFLAPAGNLCLLQVLFGLPGPQTWPGNPGPTAVCPEGALFVPGIVVSSRIPRQAQGEIS